MPMALVRNCLSAHELIGLGFIWASFNHGSYICTWYMRHMRYRFPFLVNRVSARTLHCKET